MRDQEADAAQTLAFYTRALACARLEDVQGAILAPVCRELKANSAVFLRYVRQNDQSVAIGGGSTFALNPASLACYSEGYFRDDPVTKATARVAGRTNRADVVALADLTQEDSFRRSDYYHGFLAAFGIDDVIASFTPVNSLRTEVLCVGIHRFKGQARFTQAEMAKLRRLNPAISAALSNIALREAAEGAGEALSALADSPRQPIGLVVLDGKFSLLHGNQKGLRDLGYADPALGAVWQAELREAASGLREDRPGPVRLGLEDGGVEVSIVRRTLSDGAVRYIVSSTPAEARARMTEQCRRFELTARETEIGQLIAAGLSNEGIALRLAISVRTVENHLTSIFAKAGARSRTHLAARLLGVDE